MPKRIIRTISGFILALGTVFGLGLSATAAHAATPEICDLSDACLNAWNGGPYVNTYGPAFKNDNFEIQPIDGRCAKGSDLTTANCPYSGVPKGLLIIQIKYINTGNCLGDFNGLSSDARAGAFDACNSTSTGTGGYYGTVFFEYDVFTNDQGTCPPGYFNIYSAHWPNGGLNYPQPGDNEPWYLNSNPPDCLNQGAY
jgi:hypothetical protein